MKTILSISLVLIVFSSAARPKKEINQALQKLADAKVIMTYERISLNRNSLYELDSAFVKFSKEGLHNYQGYNEKYTFETIGDSSQTTTPSTSYKTKKHGGFYEIRFLRSLVETEEIIGQWLRKGFRIADESKTISTYIHTFKNDKGYFKINLDAYGRIVQIVDRIIDEDSYSNDSIILTLRFVDQDIPRSHFKYEPRMAKNQLETVGANYYPFKSLTKLDSLTLLSGTKSDTIRRVVIYGYLGCGPCHILKNYLKEMCTDLEIPMDRVIVVNNNDPNDEILSYINRKNITFTYYKTDKSTINWRAPTIGFYNEKGELVKTDYGASKTQASVIAAYLLGKDKLLKLMKWELD